jgi:hypothetical protein
MGQIKGSSPTLFLAGPLPLLRIYLGMLVTFLIVVPVSIQRYPAIGELLWLEGGLVENATSVAYVAAAIGSIFAYARLRSAVTIATFVTAILCLSSEISLLLMLFKENTPQVPFREGAVVIDAPHDMVRLAYLNIVVDRSITWIIAILLLFVAVSLLAHFMFEKALARSEFLFTPEAILFFILFIAAGLIATILSLGIFSVSAFPAVEESLELWAATALVFGVGALRSSRGANRNPS